MLAEDTNTTKTFLTVKSDTIKSRFQKAGVIRKCTIFGGMSSKERGSFMYDVGKISMSPILSKAISASEDIAKIVADSIMRYKNLDFGDIEEAAKQINSENVVNNKPTLGAYPVGNNDEIVIFTFLNDDSERNTMCMFLQEWDEVSKRNESQE